MGRRDKDKDRYEVTLKYAGLRLNDEQVEQWDDLRPKPKKSALTRIGKGSMDLHLQNVKASQFAKKVELQKKDDELSREKNPDRRKSLESRRASLKREVDVLDKHKEEIENLTTTYEKLREDGKLEYRVYIIVEGQNVDLFRSKQRK
jgi:hypothetical protein